MKGLFVALLCCCAPAYPQVPVPKAKVDVIALLPRLGDRKGCTQFRFVSAEQHWS
jgi:hypothetical protein